MLRMCVLTVFGETDSTLALSDLDRFAGRCSAGDRRRGAISRSAAQKPTG
jgi:hypothetical protein